MEIVYSNLHCLTDFSNDLTSLNYFAEFLICLILILWGFFLRFFLIRHFSALSHKYFNYYDTNLHVLYFFSVPKESLCILPIFHIFIFPLVCVNNLFLIRSREIYSFFFWRGVVTDLVWIL